MSTNPRALYCPRHLHRLPHRPGVFVSVLLRNITRTKYTVGFVVLHVLMTFRKRRTHNFDNIITTFQNFFFNSSLISDISRIKRVQFFSNPIILRGKMQKSYRRHATETQKSKAGSTNFLFKKFLCTAKEFYGIKLATSSTENTICDDVDRLFVALKSADETYNLIFEYYK
uniref:Uncharacterized protein n=1 Tax=Romanomermis culicivorax TaxID=13658 RepID=A0A915K6T4_ROMCU